MSWIRWAWIRWRVPEQLDQEKFEREYREWICSMAKDAALRMTLQSAARRERTIELYKQLQDPRAVFRKISDLQRIKRLAGDEISNYILAETDAVTFFPSIHSTVPGVLDFAVAMNRRFFCKDLWFPIIALNSEYIEQSSDGVLGFTLEHEFEMDRIYQKISTNLRALSGEEKREVASSAQEISARKRQITQSELIEDEKLMIQLSKSQPLIPKPYAEMALLLYLEDNFSDLRSLGLTSRSDEEKSFGAELYEEFRGWSNFSKNTFSLFVREILAYLKEINRGYS
jgi:hypothetical protein